MEITVGILQLCIRTLHEGEDVLYELHVRHKRALRHLPAVDLNTDVFHQPETGAGRSDPMVVVVSVSIPGVLDRIPHFHDEVGLAQSHEVVG